MTTTLTPRTARRSAASKRRCLQAAGASLGIETGGAREVVQRVERGLSFKALESLAAMSGIPVRALASVMAIPERTLARRKAANRLTPEESEKLLRIARVFERAVFLFEGDVRGAVRWLTVPKRVFDRRSPLEYSRTEPGAREVENVIGRLEHGIFT
jgi:putative toxin-antitoxin system antitoxin component (TIGR02293 family)